MGARASVVVPLVVTLSGCSGSFVVDIPADDDGPVCEATTGNCDEFDFNGCETDLATSMEHCGACGITCAAGDRCRDGRCVGRYVELAAGDRHTCGRDHDGRVRCWGDAPRDPFPSVHDAVAISARCVVRGGGDVTCRTDTGTTTTLRSTATQVASSRLHHCAIRADRDVTCWGDNQEGALGVTGSNTTTVAAVEGVREVTSVAVNRRATCVTDAEGKVTCWGTLRLPASSQRQRVPPTVIPGIDDAEAVSMGDDHACARTRDGTTRCWGDDRRLQLGDAMASSFGSIRGPATAVASGGASSCLVSADGAVTCWGAGSSGQLGRPALPDSGRPEVVAGLPAITAIAMGLEHACGLSEDHQVWCWGSNGHGQAGPATTRRPRPVPVEGLEDVVVLTARGHHACAVDEDGEARCWGSNQSHQIDAGTFTATSTPRRVAAGARLSVAGRGHTCTVDTSGTGTCRGRWRAAGGELSAPGLGEVEQLAAGDRATCGRTSGGAVSCWGDNLALGVDAARPVERADLTGATHLALGRDHGCVARADGAVACWGSNAAGQLGVAGIAAAPMSTEVPRLDDIVAVFTGPMSTCGVHDGGAVSCWGRLPAGPPTPQVQPGLDRVAQVALGDGFVCVRRGDGEVVCWGDNRSGQLGDNTLASRTRPSAVTLFRDATQIAAGDDFVCALRPSRTVWCWGSDAHGQLGSGRTLFYGRPFRSWVNNL